jgi:hypothetical protein
MLLLRYIVSVSKAANLEMVPEHSARIDGDAEPLLERHGANSDGVAINGWRNPT